MGTACAGEATRNGAIPARGLAPFMGLFDQVDPKRCSPSEEVESPEEAFISSRTSSASMIMMFMMDRSISVFSE